MRWVSFHNEEDLRRGASDETRNPLARVEGVRLSNADFVCSDPGLLRKPVSELSRPGSRPASLAAKAFGARRRALPIIAMRQAVDNGELLVSLSPPN